jgi:ADP-ribose pyrophosphatase
VERVVESRVLHRGAFLEFRVDTVERADGTRATRDIAGHPGAVAIVALDAKDRVALVRQWRLPADAALLEIPAGGLDVGADGTKEDPENAAPRELEEETGLRAGSWRKLGAFYSAPGFTDELMHLYLATDLQPVADGRLGPDEDERLILEWRPWREAVAAAERGEIRDAKSIVGLFWLARLKGEGDLARAADEEPADADLITVRYRMSTSELVRANVALLRFSSGVKIFGLLAVAFGVGSTVLAGGDMGAVLINLPFVLLGFAFLTGWFAAPFAWYQARKRPDLVRAETEIRVSERGIRYSSSQFNGLTTWETYRRVHDSRDFFFLDTAMGVNQVVPKRAFAATDLGTLYRLFERHGLLTAR